MCEGSLANITTEVIWMSAGILNEVDAIVDALKPRFYFADEAVEKLAQTSGLPGAAGKSASDVTKPVVARYHDRIHEQVRVITEPVNAATADFVDTYASNLDGLLRAAVERAAADPTSFAAGTTTTVEDTKDKAHVGISAWASTFVAMAAVLGAAFVQNRRSHFYPDEV